MQVSGVQEASRYDVFLSFRGPDTRKKFADHLYTALIRNGFHAFRDKEEIEEGESVRLEIENAIRRSTISVVILSKNYACSKWCLTELALIMERRRIGGHHVLPVFYEVEPSQVRYQTGEVAKAFARRESEIEAETWRKALREIADLSGMTLDNGYEAKFVEVIVNSIRKKLDKQLLPVSCHLVGREGLRCQIASGQRYITNVTNPIIDNIGGLGERTTSRTVFNPISNDIGSCSPFARRKASENEIIPFHMGSPSDIRKDINLQNSRTHSLMTESDFIEHAVKEIKKQLPKPKLQLPRGVVGREDLITEINDWVQSETDDVGVAILFGSSGVGKTTTAKIVYDLNYARFERSRFQDNNGYLGEYDLVRFLLGVAGEEDVDLLGVASEEDVDSSNLDEKFMKIKEVIFCRRALIVLDNLSLDYSFKGLWGLMQKCFGPGSKIIMIENGGWGYGENVKEFEVPKLSFYESLQLLGWNAFGLDHPVKAYAERSEKIVRRCGGDPTTLKVIGCILKEKSLSEWEMVLNELSLDNQGNSVLKISYNRLSDRYKGLFLDVAHFFVGKDKAKVITILEGCGYNAKIGIQNLIDHCFLSVDENNKIGVAFPLENMAKEIVRQESSEYPEKRSRLLGEDACHVLRNEIGTETVEGMSVRDYIMRHYRLHLKMEEFKNMQNLRLLRLDNCYLKGNYEEFPQKLVWLTWHGFSLGSIPKKLHLKSLVALEMCNSRLTHNWKNGKVLFLLKFLNLSACRNFIRMPDLEGLPNLERLILEDCINLVEVNASIRELKKLIFLNLRGCRRLRKLSEVIAELEFLEELDVSHCPKLEQLPNCLSRKHSLKIHHSVKISANQSKRTTEEMEKFSTLGPQSQKLQEGIHSLGKHESIPSIQCMQSNQMRTCTKVLMEGAELGRSVDLSRLNSYEDLFKELEKMFKIEGGLLMKKWLVVYIDNEDDKMMVGDDPWHEFRSLVKKIIIQPSQEVNNSISSSASLLYVSKFYGESSSLRNQISGVQEASSSDYDGSYDVFLSFEPGDVCQNFVDRLYSALNVTGIQTFKGKEMGIRESRMSIIVFSNGYALSKWCLDELAEIMECLHIYRRCVLPIYYDIDPEQVRTQAVDFARAFGRRKMLFTKDGGRTESWIKAITQVMALPGLILQKGKAF